MVTASHNPMQDNGYKLYWGNGAQIISPHDVNIARYILENLEPWEVSNVCTVCMQCMYEYILYMNIYMQNTWISIRRNFYILF